MKRYFFIAFLCGLFAAMLALPKVVFEGAASGLLLWFNTVLPTLFPFLIITGLLIGTNAIYLIAKVIHPILGSLFHISAPASFAVLGGFLCGYPMGAKIASDLASSGHISKTEGEYLLSFCNNTSPMFVISYIFLQNLNRPNLAGISLAILIFSAVCSSFLFRHFIYRRQNPSLSTERLSPGNAQTSSEANSLTFLGILDQCIMNSCETITKVGGYIIVFSILSALMRELPFSGFLWNCLILPSLEITGGIQMLCSQALPFSAQYILIMALTSFGGLCAVFQTQCMVQDNRFSLFFYIIEKLITALVTSLLTYCFIKFIF